MLSSLTLEAQNFLAGTKDRDKYLSGRNNRK